MVIIEMYRNIKNNILNLLNRFNKLNAILNIERKNIKGGGVEYGTSLF